MPLSSLSYAFVGGGQMAEAMISGIMSTEPHARVTASHPAEQRRQQLQDRHGIVCHADNAAATADADVVVLCVKPQVFPRVANELQGRINPTAVVMSIMAGIGCPALAERLEHTAIVRAMPNTPAQIGLGMTVWMKTCSVTDAQADGVRALMGVLGEHEEVTSERHIDMATALSGTGPTYAFLMMEALVDAGVQLGFSRRVAERIVEQTVAGSVAYAIQSDRHLAELRNMVTSPGGTSAAAIAEMERGRLRTVYADAVHAAFRRAEELGGVNRP